MVNNNIFEDIRKSVDIVEVINHYVPLVRAGKNYKGLCPFHSDSNPSMVVSPEKQIFTCFSCGATGNVFTFVRDFEKISFIQSVKRVCDITGVKFPEELEEKKTESKHSSIENRLYSLLKDLTNFYSYQLKVTSGDIAVQYLKQRNLNEEEINKFQIGYAPADGVSSIRFLQSKGYSLDEIITSGVGSENANMEVVDRLRGRVIFPLCDSYGRVVAYSGRRINQDGEKYVNTPETILFKKGSMLYNYHNAYNYGKKEQCSYIVEGFMDAIALTKAGINSVVATMGTAFTPEHIKLLQSLRNEIRLFFDSDGAGLNATNKALDILSKSKIKVKVVQPMEESKDIDELLQSQGSAAVISIINRVWNEFDFRLYYLERKLNLQNHDDLKKYAQEAASFLAHQGIDSFDKEHYINLISRKTGFSKELIKQYINHNMEPDDYYDSYADYLTPKKVTFKKQKKFLNRYALADRQIIKMMLEDPMNILKYINSEVFLSTKVCRDLAALIVAKFQEENEVSIASLFNDLKGELSIELGEIIQDEYPQIEFEKLINIILVDYSVEMENEDLERRLDETNNDDEKLAIAAKIIEQRKKKQCK